ncbi:MAG: GNAT family N-acetyltransferase [Dysgonamonadaceae bacterium]|jgi:predicted acetyltransferase|nr:GNAT family N-acetyltransferase [Dysgonamonadaceae bacterium]
MIQQGDSQYKDRLKAMWKLCFPHDSNKFVDFYFKRVYKNEEAIIYMENDSLVAFLQMIPYSLKFGTEIFQAGYISGAMTHPDYRRKGYMEKLLNASFDIMRKKGYSYTFLIPQEKWLFGFYEKYGFRRIGNQLNDPVLSEENVGISNFSVFKGKEHEKEPSLWKSYFKFLVEKENAVLKTSMQFSNILLDFFDDEGVLFANNAGIAFTLKKDNTIIIKEFFCQNKTVYDEFLTAITQYYNSDEIIFPDKNQGMIKMLDDSAKEISSLYLGMMLD